MRYLIVSALVFLMSCAEDEPFTFTGDRIYYSYQSTHVLTEEEFYYFVDLANDKYGKAVRCESEALDGLDIDFSKPLPGIGISTWYGKLFNEDVCVDFYKDHRLNDLLINPYCTVSEIEEMFDLYIFEWAGYYIEDEIKANKAISECL